MATFRGSPSISNYCWIRAAAQEIMYDFTGLGRYNEGSKLKGGRLSPCAKHPLPLGKASVDPFHNDAFWGDVYGMLSHIGDSLNE